MRKCLISNIHYQGVCHKCQKGYYYPNGNRFAKPEDERKLKCVLCGYPEKENNLKVKAKNLVDVTEITERQKMALYLALQIKVGNMTKEEALEEAHKFNNYMNSAPEANMKNFFDHEDI